MKPPKPIVRAFYVSIFLIFCSVSHAQQKIKILDGTKKVGQFSVELKHNLPGKPTVSFDGNGGEVEVESDVNSFILHMSNFLWYEMEGQPEISFDTEEIKFDSKAKAAINQKTKVVSLKPIENYIREIYFEIEGKGDVKLNIPFTYKGGKGQFTQSFRIVTPSDKLEELSSSDIGKIWREVDTESKSEVEEFLTTYGELPKANRYVKLANKAETVIEAREMLEKEQKKLDESKLVDARGSDSDDIDELDNEKLVEDVKAIVDSLYKDEPEEEDFKLYNLSIIHKDDISIIKVANTEMPLQLNLKKVGEEEMNLLNTINIPAFTRDSAVELSAGLLNENRIKGAFNELNIVNAQGLEVYKTAALLENKAQKKSNTKLLIYALSFLLVSLGVFAFLNKRNKEKRQAENKKKIQQKMAQNKVTAEQSMDTKPGKLTTNDSVPTSNSEKKGKIVIGQKTALRKASELTPKSSVARSTGLSSRKIKITKKKVAGKPIPYADFVKLVNANKTVNLNLSHIWLDSKIQNVYLTPEFIGDLDAFLAESSSDGIQNELQGAIPEVGGFMMGRFSDHQDALQVLVEKFVPFVPEYNDVFKIEIGTKTIVDELGDAQDKNPDLEVIGWFHTHPGHGLFLSTSDLSVQRHFPSDYQVAMEIDSLTKGLDMSIFTRQSSGRMNNSTDRKEGVGWFQWVDIENSNLN